MSILTSSAKPLELARQRRRPRFSHPEPLQVEPQQTLLATLSAIKDAVLDKPTTPPRAHSVSDSHVSSSSHASTSDGPYEQELILLRLMRGEGISSYENLGLIEQCDGCKQFFLSVHLRPHIVLCVGEDEPDLKEDLRRYSQREASVEV